MATGVATVVSSPGKVLIAGGYLVLEPAYPGLVISTTSRFYTVIQSSSSTLDAKEEAYSSRISVRAPQFSNALWEYNVKLDKDRCLVEQTQSSYESKDAGENPFVGSAVLYALRLALEATSVEQVQNVLGPNGIQVHVLADNDFYSQRQKGETAAPTSQSLLALPPFNRQSHTIRNVHKTGLGSSAAMTTSLVGALLLHFGVVHYDQAAMSLERGDESLALIHNTAQLAHCAAQGKVGSGFDVSAAVWGSQLYRRFDKEAIQALLDAGERVTVQGKADQTNATQPPELAPFLDPRNPLWCPSPMSHAGKGKAISTAAEGLAYTSSTDSGTTIARPAPLELPPHVELMLADVDAGSNTPSMVGKILAWRKDNPSWSQQLWTILASANRTLADGLLALRLAHAQDSRAYDEAILLASQHFSREWDTLLKTNPSATLALLVEIRNAMRAVQGGMRELGRQANVPVEPNEMGDVIKATVDGAHGVIGGGVPGAGGYDALFVLVLHLPQAQEQTVDSADGIDAASLTQPLPTSLAEREVQGVWSHWKALSVGPLLSRSGASAGAASSVDQIRTSMLTQGAPPTMPVLPPSKIEPGGLRVHALDTVVGLREAIGLDP